MKHFIFIICILFMNLEAKSTDICYSVQLKSFVIKDPASYIFEDYPSSCFLFRGKKISSIRCGCFDGYSEAKTYQKSLEKEEQNSLIVETYKYRIPNKYKNLDTDNNEEELRLLFQVFSYSSDVENAYKTAQKALRSYPDSLYWHEKMSEVCMWTDRREEAVNHMMYVYKRTHNKKLEDKMFKYSISAYQYETAAYLIEKKVRENPNKENVQKMVFIFDLTGKPLESAQLLDEIYKKDPSQKALLSQELQIYLNMGEMQKAGELVKRIEKENMHDLHSAYLISHYYFLAQDVNASYKALIEADIKASDTNLNAYYKQLSDLAWYVKEYEKSALASIKLDEVDEARLVDFERILSVYKKKDPSIAMKAALDAYKKFSKNYLFYTYVYMAMNERAYEQALQNCDKAEQNRENTLVQEALYWMIKAELYASLNQNTQAKKAFYTAQLLSPISNQILESYIWFLMGIKDERALSQLLFSLEEKGKLSSSLWLPMAVAYFYIQNGDRTEYYLNLLSEYGLQTRDSKLLYAYVKLSQNEEGAFYKQLRDLKKQMDLELKAEPILKKKSEFMQAYLSVSMFLMGADDFRAKLEDSRHILKVQAYNELILSFSLRENVDENVHTSAALIKKPEPWIRLTVFLSSNDKTSQQDVLYKHFRILPVGDALAAAQNTMQISFAQDIIFDGLAKNEKNELLYDQMRQLHNEYADSFLIRAGYLDRTGLSQSYSDMHNSYYLAKGYSLEADLFIASNSSNDDEVFKTIPSSTTAFALGFKKYFERGVYTLSAGIKDSADSYNSLSFTYNTIISRRLNLEVLVDKGANAQESVYLLVGGYKDRFALQTRYSLLGSSSLGLYLEKANYFSDDGQDLGDGLNGRLDFSYLQRSAYPDISITPYYTFGNYNETSGSKGVIDEMLNFPDTQVISDDFWYTGLELSYGMENRYNYVRVWRPFFSVNPYYNGREEKLNYGFSAGMGGELFGQDNLSFILDYSESVGGTSDQLWRSYFRYKILY